MFSFSSFCAFISNELHYIIVRCVARVSTFCLFEGYAYSSPRRRVPILRSFSCQSFVRSRAPSKNIFLVFLFSIRLSLPFSWIDARKIFFFFYFFFLQTRTKRKGAAMLWRWMTETLSVTADIHRCDSLDKRNKCKSTTTIDKNKAYIRLRFWLTDSPKIKN